ncbi:MAG TPA: alginate lyase family protein [Candidatus Marinimicrobia bacterium]|nr:alginate lyase family protein [Candidatus Neomarinimicrobiota bacterium]
MHLKSLCSFFESKLLLLLIALIASVQCEELQLNFFRRPELEQLKNALVEPEGELLSYKKTLMCSANLLLKEKSVSIVDFPCPNSNIDRHDYYSESTYWWPNPKDLDGPYIRKDGVRNPNRFLKHKEALNHLCQSTLTLSASAYLFDNIQYAEKAKELIYVWFVDSATRMTPHAKYAQVIPNSDKQRGVGILDTRRLIFVVEAIQILKLAGYWDVDLEIELTKWFSEYLDWLLYSEYGKDERQRGNNHSTWYAVQVITYANYLGNKIVANETWDYVCNNLLARQIEADGKMPLEMDRTQSLGYFIFNLEAWSYLSRLAENNHINLWKFQNAKGGSLAKSVQYILPYLERPDTWPLEQINSIRRHEESFLLFGGKALENSKMVEIYCSVMSKEIIKEEVFLFILNMMVLSGIL